MSIKIQDDDDIRKLFAFVRVRAKGEFLIAVDVLEEVVCGLREFAKSNNINIEAYTPTNEKIFYFGAGGAITGAAAGYLIGSFPGMAIGFVAGGIVGCSIAHVKLVIHKPDDGSNFYHLHIV